MKRKILAVLLCSLSLQIFPLTAYGQSSFKDVPIDSIYYREIDYFREHEIIKGTGDGCFRPNSNITATDYLIMLYNATGYACNLYGCPEYLFIDIIDNFGIRHLTEKKYISKLDVLVQGCKALDIMPYSAKYYSLDGFERFSALSQDEQDVLMLCGRNAVLDLSAETSDTLTAPVTRGEAAKLLYNLIQFHDTQLPLVQPETSMALDIEVSEEVTDEYELVEILNDIADLPSWLVDDFNEESMKIFVYPFADEEENIAGKYYYQQKRITFNSERSNCSTVYHEFGHHLYFRFVVEQGKKDPDLQIVKELYTAEKEKISEFYREYGATDHIEFFADAFTCYIYAQLNNTQDVMEQGLPMTYEYMDSLIDELSGTRN